MEDDLLGALGVRARGTEEVERAVLAEAARKAGEEDAEAEEHISAHEARERYMMHLLQVLWRPAWLGVALFCIATSASPHFTGSSPRPRERRARDSSCRCGPSRGGALGAR